MKRTTRLIALLCALVLLAALAGCGKGPTPTPNPTPTPEYEMIAVTMPEQQPGEATEKIIKAVNSLSGVWALSEDHNLYRMQLENNEPDMSTMEVAYQHVQDFSLGSFGEYINILYTTGRLERYWTDHDYGELPEPLEAHCRATAEAAMEIVCALAAAGVCLDETPVYAAALLHDVSKGTPDHALAGAGLMSQLGYPALAPLIAQHHDIEDPARVDEALVVYMADKLCRGDRRVSVSGRFRASFDKCRDAEALAAHDRRYKAALTAAHTINDICGKEVIPI